MKKITVISGKGGTGKTSLTGSFAVLAGNRAVLVDGDVDAANLSLIMKPLQIEKHEFRASRVAVIDQDSCSSCELCRRLCRFNAIPEDYKIDPIACEGCFFCSYACPEGAIRMEERISGHWYVSESPYGVLVHARLGIAEENSGKLVTTIRNKGEAIAVQEGKELVIIDGPPGIGCPVIASLSGVDIALVVTEPSVSGIHDLKRVVELCSHFGVQALVCINRYDIALEQSEMIENYCAGEGLLLAGKIPYHRAFVEAMIQGVPVVDFIDGTLSSSISAVWDRVTSLLY